MHLKNTKTGEFLLAISILEMEENTQQFSHIVLYYFKRSENAIEIQKKICEVYGKGAVTDCTGPSCVKSGL